MKMRPRAAFGFTNSFGLLTMLVVFFIASFSPSESFAAQKNSGNTTVTAPTGNNITEISGKSKSGNSGKKLKKKIKKKTPRKVQSPEKSLELLSAYNPEYSAALKSKDIAILDNNAIPKVDKNSIFYEKSRRIELLSIIKDWLGTRYQRGGRTKNGVDCSNFTSRALRETFGFLFPASPGEQAKLFEPIKSKSNLQFGDLIFFTGRNRHSERIGHVGIYIGNGVFAHSSTGRGVIYSHISEGYYEQRFRYGGRLAKEDWESKISD